MKLTEEQKKAVKLYSDGHDTIIRAFAGAGKTSTLISMAKSDQSNQGLYIAFNKAIATEAQARFPYNVRCSTAHSVAFRYVRGFHDTVKMTENLSLFNAGITRFAETMAMSRELVMMTLRRFLQSADTTIEDHHVPNLEKMGFDPSQAARYAPAALLEAERVWQKMTDPKDKFPMGHDGYLKLWQISRPRLDVDTLFVDEAQDLSPVLLSVVRRQKCQIVAVGDSHQQIYEWRGAIDALDKMKGKTAYITQSFRFGEDIAEAAGQMLILLGEDRVLRGTNKDSKVIQYNLDDNDAWTDAILCRTNNGVIKNVCEQLNQDRKVYVEGGTHELKKIVNDAESLMDGVPPVSGDFMAFTTWQEAQDFADSEEGKHLKSSVNLIDKYGTDTLRSALDRCSSHPTPGCVTVTTTHKGKGREWDSVRVDGDFCLPKEDKKVSRAQLRLMYVAMTRAKKALSLPYGILTDYMKAEIQ